MFPVETFSSEWKSWKRRKLAYMINLLQRFFPAEFVAACTRTYTSRDGCVIRHYGGVTYMEISSDSHLGYRCFVYENCISKQTSVTVALVNITDFALYKQCQANQTIVWCYSISCYAQNASRTTRQKLKFMLVIVKLCVLFSAVWIKRSVIKGLGDLLLTMDHMDKERDHLQIEEHQNPMWK